MARRQNVTLTKCRSTLNHPPTPIEAKLRPIISVASASIENNQIFEQNFAKLYSKLERLPLSENVPQDYLSYTGLQPTNLWRK